MTAPTGGTGPLIGSDLETVLAIPLFDGLGRETVLPLIQEARVSTYGDRTLLFSRGDPADRFYVVLAGQVRLYVLTADGRESVIEFIAPGQSFAEAALFGSGRLPVDGEAAAGTRLARLPARAILAGIAADATLARKMMDSLVRRQRHLIARIGDLKLRSPGQRLAAVLLELAAPDQNGQGHVRATVHLDSSKAGLASRIGITPESLSRALARLRRLGVTSRGADVVIADVPALRRYCEDREPDA